MQRDGEKSWLEWRGDGGSQPVSQVNSRSLAEGLTSEENKWYLNILLRIAVNTCETMGGGRGQRRGRDLNIRMGTGPGEPAVGGETHRRKKRGDSNGGNIKFRVRKYSILD
ncbi:hypothetical protein GWI33_009542 [Rhynchophorus ferrugineus]|uniref:Uncharacterized protein n=1 Tax=Rhynchophorus ferrugineus TaxID=354439 RepID=A0A834IXR5_RHYFE|nr:hypothetical protein GWI33_009542 [Rhynchophorus ferrugineus]